MDDFGVQEVRSSGELWSDICSTLPEVKDQVANQADNTHFTDSFQPSSQVNGQSANVQSPNVQSPNGTSTKWEPMDDSEVYIASLESRLKRLKGHSSDVTSRDMLKSLSQAKKECWDRFLHDTQTSELFQSDDLDEGALEHFKRWLIPEKVAISAEELEYLLRPSENRETLDGGAMPERTQNEGDEVNGERASSEEDDAHHPEK
ncbi:Coiled-coil domain-containing protein 32 [Merluccius polli]|uniref:Coiled-coil domain-containing protein 32 n=1 Tax=Merluccius polli TaxID=89951 RepID=A0AA47P9A2_MERPO|nr:Coiled-coil domain-containing protein 32 [Merluccius polli]